MFGVKTWLSTPETVYLCELCDHAIHPAGNNWVTFKDTTIESSRCSNFRNQNPFVKCDILGMLDSSFNRIWGLMQNNINH